MVSHWSRFWVLGVKAPAHKLLSPTKFTALPPFPTETVLLEYLDPAFYTYLVFVL